MPQKSVDTNFIGGVGYQFNTPKNLRNTNSGSVVGDAINNSKSIPVGRLIVTRP